MNKSVYTFSYFIYFIIALIVVIGSSMQPCKAQVIVHPVNKEARYNIDAKRAISDPESRDGLLRSIEFKRIDSTYYIGYLFEGIYKEKHAADYPGYKQAIPPLLRAIELLEKDYHKELSVKSTDYYTLFPAYGIQMDYQQLLDKLWTCYMNTEQFQEAYNVSRRAQQYYLQLEYYFNTYTSLAWLIHKIRVHNTSDFNFLKQTVAENEALAQQMLDSAIITAQLKDEYNAYIMPDLTQVNMDNVLHYRAMLYSYNLQIDSADKYYDLLKEQSFYSHNNRGNYLAVKGDFAAAAVEYNLEAKRASKDKELREYAYFNSILNIYKAQPSQGLTYLQNIVKTTGSTPGFGWYNIGLARAAIYDGDLELAASYIQKASRFKELHIGTSFGQAQYDFSLNVVKLLYAKSALAWLQKRHDNILFTPSAWGQYLALQWDIYITKHLVITQLSDNPERDAVLYKIFATESTATWDEIFLLIESLNPAYFIDYYEALLINDTQRPYVHKYYKLLLAKLYVQEGATEKAIEYLTSILQSSESMDEYDALLLARTYELLATLMEDNSAQQLAYSMRVFEIFPQIAGYSKLPIPVKIEWKGAHNTAITDALADTDIQIVATAQEQQVILSIEVEQAGNPQWVVNIALLDSSGAVIRQSQQYTSATVDPIAHSITKFIYGMMLPTVTPVL